MGANGDAGYLTSSSAPDFLLARAATPWRRSANTPAHRRRPPRAGGSKSVPAKANADDLPFDPVVKPSAVGARRQSFCTRSLAAEQGHFDS